MAPRGLQNAGSDRRRQHHTSRGRRHCPPAQPRSIRPEGAQRSSPRATTCGGGPRGHGPSAPRARVPGAAPALPRVPDGDGGGGGGGGGRGRRGQRGWDWNSRRADPTSLADSCPQAASATTRRRRGRQTGRGRDRLTCVGNQTRNTSESRAWILKCGKH